MASLLVISSISLFQKVPALTAKKAWKSSFGAISTAATVLLNCEAEYVPAIGWDEESITPKRPKTAYRRRIPCPLFCQGFTVPYSTHFGSATLAIASRRSG